MRRDPTSVQIGLAGGPFDLRGDRAGGRRRHRRRRDLHLRNSLHLFHGVRVVQVTV